MDVTLSMLLAVCPLAFLAAFVDSVAGGGGLISLPAYYLAGLPPHLAAGTNKLSAGLGAIAASGRFLAGGKVAGKVALLSALLALPGSWLGARVQLLIPPNTVRVMMLCMIPLVAVVVLGRKGDLAPRFHLAPGAMAPVSMAVGLGIGFYDGLVGPGTGTFLILLFTLVMGLDPVQASGTAKLVNLASNVAAFVTYAAAGQVMYRLGFPAAACAIAGSLLGAQLTITKGTRFIRGMLLAVLALLLAKMLYDVVS